ncbi:MAG: hypothetical protein PVJ52_00475 [Candidatus Woesebacteria bacterium]|jgi:hypothetical protein
MGKERNKRLKNIGDTSALIVEPVGWLWKSEENQGTEVAKFIVNAAILMGSVYFQRHGDFDALDAISIGAALFTGKHMISLYLNSKDHVYGPKPR